MYVDCGILNEIRKGNNMTILNYEKTIYPKDHEGEGEHELVLSVGQKISTRDTTIFIMEITRSKYDTSVINIKYKYTLSELFTQSSYINTIYNWLNGKSFTVNYFDMPT